MSASGQSDNRMGTAVTRRRIVMAGIGALQIKEDKAPHRRGGNSIARQVEQHLDQPVPVRQYKGQIRRNSEIGRAHV